MFNSRFRALCAPALLLVIVAALSPQAIAEPLTLRRAVQLALQHSTGIAIADADEKREEQNVLAKRDFSIPQVNVGAGLGYGNGFPLSLETLPPSLLTVTTQGYISKMAKRKFVRAARRDLASFSKLA